MNTLTLPSLPPSVNKAFTNVPGKGRVRTAAYRKWANEAGWAVNASRAWAHAVKGPVKVRVTFGRPDRRRRDLDNLAKCTLDLMVKHELIEDDAQVEDLHLRWDTTGKVVGVRIEWGGADGVD